MNKNFDVYSVVINGTDVIFEHFNKKPALRKAMSYARKNKTDYVELRYTYSDGNWSLVDFWN